MRSDTRVGMIVATTAGVALAWLVVLPRVFDETATGCSRSARSRRP
jgi:hypothetical protein